MSSALPGHLRVGPTAPLVKEEQVRRGVNPESAGPSDRLSQPRRAVPSTETGRGQAGRANSSAGSSVQGDQVAGDRFGEVGGVAAAGEVGGEAAELGGG